MFIASLVILFIGFIFVISYPFNMKKNKRCTEQTEGVLSDIVRRYDSDGDLKDMHVYSYNVNGVDYQLRTVDHNLEVHEIGDRCTIWYNPKKPKDAQAFRGSVKYLKTLLKIGIALVLLGILLFCIAFVQFFGL